MIKNMINAKTEHYCVIGNPVFHSLSPLMHNLAFQECHYNGVYTACEVSDLKSAVKGIRALGIKGVSVTIPHKINIMHYLDDIEESAERIGAVNTVLNVDGKLTGYNTDCMGIVHSLQEKTEIINKKVAVIGSGGAARAAGFGIIKEGADVLVVNRTEKRGTSLADDLGCAYMNLQEFNGDNIDIIINTTPVGMHPEIDKSPLEDDRLNTCSVVMDIIYNPIKTKLLELAEKKGCEIVSGVSMFAYQGAEQFRLWTGIKPPVDKMKEIVIINLNKK